MEFDPIENGRSDNKSESSPEAKPNYANKLADEVSSLTNEVSSFTNDLIKTSNQRLSEALMYAELVAPLSLRAERFYKAAKAEPPEVPKPVEWLFVVNMTTRTFGSYSGDNNENRLKQFSSIVDKTKGKPVAVVVQMPYADVDENAYDGDQLDAYSFLVPHPHRLDRYIIHDGKMERVSSVNSGGYADDLTGICTVSGQHFKANRKALIMDSHGNGNGGLSGDTGKVSLETFVEATKLGLEAAEPKPGAQAVPENNQGKKNKQDLDLINFDACYMGQDDVLRLVGSLTKNVVASAETEGGRGQNLTASIEHVLNNPKIKPGDLGDFMVETARLQTRCQDVPRVKTAERSKATNLSEWLAEITEPEKKCNTDVSVETLAHYNLAHYDKFRNELDQLGEALTKAIEDPKNRQVVDDLIDRTPAYGNNYFFDGISFNKRDLKSFAELTMDAVSYGKLADPDGSIRIHAGRLLDSHKKLVQSYSGFYEYGSYGGLTTFAPERNDLDFHKSARDEVSACEFRDLAEDFPTDFAKEKPAYIKKLDVLTSRMEYHLGLQYYKSTQEARDEAGKELGKVSAVVDKLKNASDAETPGTLAELRNAAIALEQTKFFQERILDEKVKLKKEIDEQYKKELVDPKNGWGKFREKLRRLD